MVSLAEETGTLNVDQDLRPMTKVSIFMRSESCNYQSGG